MIAMRFEGGDRLAKALAQLSTRLSRSVQRDALLEGGEPIRARAASLAPRDARAPHMAEHLTIGPVRKQGVVAVGIGMDSTEYFYDIFQEYGTTRHGAQSFYRPAFDGESRRALGIIQSSIWGALVKRGIGSARIAQGASESFAAPRAPMVMGGPGGGLL